MKINKLFLNILMVILFCGFISSISLHAGEQGEDEFYGKFLLGYRYVDISGVESKYKEDINPFISLVSLFNEYLHDFY